MATLPSYRSLRPPIVGSHYMASTGHYLATMASVRILEMGGNAIDAGVAGGLCINVLQPDMTNIGGVAPIIVYSAQNDEIRTVSGLGSWPESATREYFMEQCDGDFPPGVHRCVMPAAIDSWLTALKEFGRLALADVAAPAIALAEDGFVTYDYFCSNLEVDSQTLAQWPSSAEVYLPGGRVPRVGERFVQKDLGRTLRMLVEAEDGAQHLGREAAIQVARDRFYKGDIAERIAAFFEEQGGFLTLNDLSEFRVDIEHPVRMNYRGYDVYGCGPWCQGPVALQALGILDGYDLASLGHNTADSLHLIIESLKAAFADREYYYGDPKFVDVPVEGLLHPKYAASWRDRISMNTASPGMPDPGNAWSFVSNRQGSASNDSDSPRAFRASVEPDTSYLCVIDEEGNAFSATPSDGVGGSPIVPGLGFMVSPRGKQSRLDPGHVSSLAPGKRPRLTPNPGLIMKDGRLFAPYGTPGLDVQPQAMVQLVVNLIDFKMDPQEAVEAARVASYSFPSSNPPNPYEPGKVRAESRISTTVLVELERRGHRVEQWPPWTPKAGSLNTILVDRSQGALIGAADARIMAYAMGW